ncbi:MAG: hypothetical protein WD314_00945 [Trueperaceae bacterium]
MNTTPPTGFPGASRTSSGYRLKRDSYVWLAGSGYRHMTRGSMLTGYLLRRNEVYQKLVVATQDGVFNVNEEDVEQVGPS